MLKIIEIASPEEFTQKYISGDTTNDYMYLLKYSNTIMFTDNGVDKYFNSVIECTQTEYNALQQKEKCIYIVTADNGTKYSYFQNTLISSTTQIASSYNKSVLWIGDFNAGSITINDWETEGFDMVAFEYYENPAGTPMHYQNSIYDVDTLKAINNTAADVMLTGLTDERYLSFTIANNILTKNNNGQYVVLSKILGLRF